MFGITAVTHHLLHRVPRGRGKDKGNAIERMRQIGRTALGERGVQHKMKFRRGDGHNKNGIHGGTARGLVLGQHGEEMIGNSGAHSMIEEKRILSDGRKGITIKY